MKFLIFILLIITQDCIAQKRNSLILRYEDSSLTVYQRVQNEKTIKFNSTNDLNKQLDTVSNKAFYNSIIIYFDSKIKLPESLFKFPNITYINLNASKIKTPDERLIRFKKLEVLEIFCDTIINININLSKIKKLSTIYIEMYSLKLESDSSYNISKELIPIKLRKSIITIVNKSSSNNLLISVNGVEFYK